MTAALELGKWSAARPGRTLPPGKTRYPFYSRLGGSQGRSGRAENLVPTRIRSRTVQPVDSRNTDCATRPTINAVNSYNYSVSTGFLRHFQLTADTMKINENQPNSPFLTVVTNYKLSPSQKTKACHIFLSYFLCSLLYSFPFPSSAYVCKTLIILQPS